MHRLSHAVFVGLCAALSFGYLGAVLPLYQYERSRFFGSRSAWGRLSWVEDFTFGGYAMLAALNIGVPCLLGWLVARTISPWRAAAPREAHIVGVMALCCAVLSVYVQFFVRFGGLLSSVNRMASFYLVGAFTVLFALVSFGLSGGRQLWAGGALAVFSIGAFERFLSVTIRMD